MAREVAALGADIMNCIPMYPVAGTPFESLGEPGPEDFARVTVLPETGLELASLRVTVTVELPPTGLVITDRLAEILGERWPRRRPPVATDGRDRSRQKARCLSAWNV